jgi:hypothetical protein
VFKVCLATEPVLLCGAWWQEGRQIATKIVCGNHAGVGYRPALASMLPERGRLTGVRSV